MAMESQSGQFSLVAFCPQRVFAVDNRAGGNIFTQAKNMLTQRTIGPVCTGSVSMDVSGMKEGDFAGLSLFQRKYGQVGVKVIDGKKYIVMVNGENEKPMEIEKVPLEQSVIYFKAECDFRNRADKGYFYYSLDGIRWKAIGNVLKMQYTMPHFMGYRFALFNYATKETEGYVDFDYFKIEDKISDCRWADVCYADDELEGHKLDIYLPDTGKSSHKVVVLIYGSAWFANNMKQNAFQVLVGRCLIKVLQWFPLITVQAGMLSSLHRLMM